MAFNISALALRADTVLQLRHPVTNDLLWEDEAQTVPVTISLHGTASKAYRNALSAAQNRQLRRNAKKDKPDASVMQEEAVQILVACSVDSTLERNGSPVNTPATFQAMYEDPAYSWVKDQVDSNLADVSNFLGE